MKRLHLREIVFLCLPIGLIAGAFLIPLIRRPPRDPDAVVSLSLKSVPSRFGRNPNVPQVNFAWEAKASGGPQYGYRLGYRQQIVAVSKTGETLVYSEPSGPRSTVGPSSSSSSGGTGYTPGQGATVSRDLLVDATHVPLNAKRLEWRGEVVAIPFQNGSTAVPASAAQLQKWAAMKGAARVVKTIPLAFDAAKNAIMEFGVEPVNANVEPVNANNAAHGSDTCVVVKLRDQPRRVYRRLIAFDGHTRRVLWDDNSDGRNRYWQGRQGDGYSGIQRDILLFRLRNVPREWGEITFLEDVVFTTDTSSSGEEISNIKTIDALAKAGNLRFSRRVVVRAAGATIRAPQFRKTPNLQFRDLKIQSDGQGTRLLVSLNYTGHNASPEIDVPNIVDVYDPAHRNDEQYVKSYIVKRGSQVGEWVLTVDLQKLENAPRKLQLDVEVGDSEAAPLHIVRDFTLPTAPSHSVVGTG